MCDAVAGDGDGADLAGQARLRVVAWAFREDALRRSFVDRQAFVQARDRQDAEARSRRGIRGGSGMQRCESSYSRESYGVNANCSGPALALVPSTAAGRSLRFGVPDVGGELGVVAVVVVSVVVPVVVLVFVV